jgi:hypothetical protein
MAAAAGEWRTLMSRDGQTTIDADLGNPWNAAYHTGRALTESVDRLRSLLSMDQIGPNNDGQRVFSETRNEI